MVNLLIVAKSMKGTYQNILAMSNTAANSLPSVGGAKGG
jgi:hypothetical protein